VQKSQFPSLDIMFSIVQWPYLAGKSPIPHLPGGGLWILCQLVRFSSYLLRGQHVITNFLASRIHTVTPARQRAPARPEHYATMPDKMSNSFPDKILERMLEGMSDRLSENMPDRMADRMSE
jgi:hypothetical protein